MTTTYFKTKEQYFQFRTNFAAATKNVKSKSTCEACDEWLEHEEKISYDTGASRVQGWLRAEHFIFLNIIRGKPLHHGFTPVTSKNKLTNGGTIWPGFDGGIRKLRRIVDNAKDLQKSPKSDPYFSLADFLEPLLGIKPMYGTLVDILCEIAPLVAENKEYHTDFGIGLKIARKMVAEDLKPTNYQEFMEIVDEINNEMKEAA